METTIIRQIMLDTETTGMNQHGTYYEGHKIIEIGAVEVINRHLTGNDFHVYLKPDRLIDQEAFLVHGISDEFLLDKPTFSDVADEFIRYICGAELIIHNAMFDIGFIDYELGKLNRDIPKISTLCRITDSLALARKIFPGKRNSLDALCTRYKIDNSKRSLHGAFLDAQILAAVYLAMTGGQTSIIFEKKNDIRNTNKVASIHSITCKGSSLRVILANNEELVDHESYLDLLEKKDGNCLWRR